MGPLLVALLVALPLHAIAHGPIDERIAAATLEIARDPGNAQLYVRRAELHRVHEDWEPALADYARAAARAPGDTAIGFLRGRALQEAGRPGQAKAVLDLFLAQDPDHAEALVARARALFALRLWSASASDYTHAIMRTPRADPDLYLERARAEAADRRIERALAGIDAGIARLGPVPALQLYAMELEIRRGGIDAALVRLDAIAAQSPRKEVWLARRGAILMQAGRREEARSAYVEAMAAIEALPPSMRQTRAMIDLAGRVNNALTRL